MFDIDVTSTSSLVGMTAAADPAGWKQPDLAVVAQRATRRARGAGESDGRQQDAAPARQVDDGEVPTAQTQVMLRASSPSVACWILRPMAGEILRTRGDGRAEDEPSHLPEATYLVLLAQDRPDHSLAIAELPLDYLARLLHAVDATPPAAHPGPAVAATPGLIDALTARELQVLQLLAAGQSNRRIAAELVVTVDTVKKHVGHVLDKLGAANRTEAAARARQLGLIS
jgi:DNA-binding CsgD family transcriptional regulator